MKLYIPILNEVFGYSFEDYTYLRHLLNDLGLEVKDIDEEKDIFTIETLANRGDHLCALGIAKEISARLTQKIKFPEMVNELPNVLVSRKISVKTEKCLSYSNLEMPFLKFKHSKLIDNYAQNIDEDKLPYIVRLLNYILSEIGQPMHAFDLEKIEGSIEVTELEIKTTIKALNGKNYDIEPGTIIIRDDIKILAIAGIIGCENSMVTNETKSVLIESAAFDPISIRTTSKKLGLSTDASQIFSRGSDVSLVEKGLRRLCTFFDGDNKNLSISFSRKFNYKEKEISVFSTKIASYLGKETIDADDLICRLDFLGIKLLEKQNDKLTFSIPPCRKWDLENECDIIEEYVKTISYNSIPMILPTIKPIYIPASPKNTVLEKKIEPILTSNGFYEIISNGLYSSTELNILTNINSNYQLLHTSLANSIDTKYAYLKVTNLFHLLKVVDVNYRKGINSIKIYELGKAFLRNKELTANGEKFNTNVTEKNILSLLCSGSWLQTLGKKSKSDSDLIFHLKGIIEKICKSIGHDCYVKQTNEFDLLHPNIQSCIFINNIQIGFIGLVLPDILTKFGLGIEYNIAYAELDWDVILNLIKVSKYNQPIEFPVVERDFTFKYPINKYVNEISNYINEFFKKDDFIIRSYPFDIFKKEDENFRRVTIKIYFQSASKTLSTEEVDNKSTEIITKLSENFNLELAM